VPNVQIKLPQQNFRVDAEIADRIHKIAQQRGISPETLVNLWLAEKFQFTPTPKTARGKSTKKERSSRLSSQI
jgi:hypothetical protein